MRSQVKAESWRGLDRAGIEKDIIKAQIRVIVRAKTMAFKSA